MHRKEQVMNRKKALCYLTDIMLGQTGEVISKDYQKARILEYAQSNGIEIIGYYEDDMYNEDVLSRPGVEAMLLDKRDYDLILVERIWAFSRSWSVLKGLLTVLKIKSVTLESATTMWDCTSQRARDHFRGRALKSRRRTETCMNEWKPVPMKAPAKLNFVMLKKA